ncbi:hypothetical protein [Granulicella sp. S156]|uniref:hypothetical protein n=1 Tax=Granulicella sp. S156 TaxID=1747224 RepID=UPI00131B9294|nr:hypothetical protein [Granulicella sp. S156]
MRKRTLIPLLIVLAVLVALGIAFYLRTQSPPEAARLLPESDAIVYIHLKTVRTMTHFDTTPVQRSGDLQRFIDATGIVPDRDIDDAAFALHRMPNPNGPNGPVAYSEVFVGRFDGQRLGKYLASIATARETYAGREIYSIPIEGRTLRVTQLGYDTIGASNTPTAEQIHSMLDRSRASALGTPGSSLLAARYSEVPLLSQAWGIGHIGLPFAKDGYISILGLQLPLPEDTDLVASLRYSGSVHLRIEEIASDPDAAQHTVETLTTLLNIVRGLGSAEPPRNPADSAMRDVLASITLEHHKDRALLNASASLDQIKALTSGGNPTASPQSTSPPPAALLH